MADFDFTQRFIFESTDVRGELASLEESYAHVLAKHEYPEPVAALLGELMTAAALLVNTLKFDGLLVLQARSSGAVPLLMVECSSDRELRAIARYESEQINSAASLQELMPEGVLAITVDPRQGQRYQGLVALDGETLADCFTSYFINSAQLPTRFWLYADGQRARGMLLQQLPADCLPDPEEREASWQHVVALASTLSGEELLGLDNETILHRLYHDEQLRLFAGTDLKFHCSCTRERSAQALLSLGLADLQLLLAEKAGTIEIDCQFCNQTYLFNEEDVMQMFAEQGAPDSSNTVH
ncbi:Hsp33 family molecular chaperone HslO [Pseudomonas sp. C27(2019)]|uniref:Hsp33 family molecular chaperone HslO n=1 Tax=Pseudomonas sp. C27(2019) TaxID=2604941 RepID=UPI0012443F9A|nr:Hsp33 family molecular chaperone HslO [Pseudomonas sp. C27(2019)]QEY57715.1 Hsp33 family molecular chaperone HslO [Pseudomonas sp. C27(2019)]